MVRGKDLTFFRKSRQHIRFKSPHLSIWRPKITPSLRHPRIGNNDLLGPLLRMRPTQIPPLRIVATIRTSTIKPKSKPPNKHLAPRIIPRHPSSTKYKLQHLKNHVEPRTNPTRIFQRNTNPRNEIHPRMEPYSQHFDTEINLHHIQRHR